MREHPSSAPRRRSWPPSPRSVRRRRLWNALGMGASGVSSWASRLEKERRGWPPGARGGAGRARARGEHVRLAARGSRPVGHRSSAQRDRDRSALGPVAVQGRPQAAHHLDVAGGAHGAHRTDRGRTAGSYDRRRPVRDRARQVGAARRPRHLGPGAGAARPAAHGDRRRRRAVPGSVTPASEPAPLSAVGRHAAPARRTACSAAASATRRWSLRRRRGLAVAVCRRTPAIRSRVIRRRAVASASRRLMPSKRPWSPP